MMKKCPNCQTEVEEEALVCPQCGYQWETNAEKVEQVVSEEVVSEEKTQSVQQAANEEVSNPENEDKAQTTVAPQTPEESEEETNNQSSENSKKVLDFEKLDDFEALKSHINQAKNYFEELKATILHPTIGEIKYKTLGIINFIVIGLLFSLTFSRLLGVMLRGIYGAMNQFTNMFGFEGIVHIREGETVSQMRTTEDQRPLPFSIRLDDFKLVRYPGSHSPSSFESFLTIHTEEGERSEHIYMNKVIYEQGYRLYQSSYDADEQGTILTVNNDTAGTGITYAGYLLLPPLVEIDLPVFPGLNKAMVPALAAAANGFSGAEIAVQKDRHSRL